MQIVDSYAVLASSVTLEVRIVDSGGLQTKITSWSCDVIAAGKSGNQIRTWT